MWTFKKVLPQQKRFLNKLVFCEYQWDFSSQALLSLTVGSEQSTHSGTNEGYMCTQEHEPVNHSPTLTWLLQLVIAWSACRNRHWVFGMAPFSGLVSHLPGNRLITLDYLYNENISTLFLLEWTDTFSGVSTFSLVHRILVSCWAEVLSSFGD